MKTCQSCFKQEEKKKRKKNMYIYIYIYICVCVCVCAFLCVENIIINYQHIMISPTNRIIYFFSLLSGNELEVTISYSTQNVLNSI